MKRFVASALAVIFCVSLFGVLICVDPADATVIITDPDYPIPPPEGYEGYWPPPDGLCGDGGDPGDSITDTLPEGGPDPWTEPDQ